MIVKEKKVNLILVGASVAFALYIIEALFMYQHLKLVIDRDKFIKSNNLEFDYRTRKQFYIDFKKDNPDAVVAFYPSNYLHLKDSKIFPLTGFSSKKTVFCNELGYYAIFDSDRYGFKNPDKEWDNNLQEYVLVGDSFTQGACVNTEDDITGNLRKILKKENKAGVLNLAFRANGSLVEYGILRGLRA